MTPISPYAWRRRIVMRDVDAYGIVWYGNYLGFCDEALAALLRAFGLPPGTFIELGYITPVVDVSARYLSPARLDEEIEVQVRIPEARGTRMTFAYTIRRTADETVLARIETAVVLMRTTGELIYLVPDELKTSIQRMIDDQPETEP